MALSKDMEDETLLFARSLFSYLFSSHPLFKDISHLSSKRKDNDFFTPKIGDAVMYSSRCNSDMLMRKFSCDFPRFIENKKSFEKYLAELLEAMVANRFNYPFSKVIVYSAVLLELISFLYRRKVTQYVYSAPYHWFNMFKHYSGLEFFQYGGWRVLELAATCALEHREEKSAEEQLKELSISQTEEVQKLANSVEEHEESYENQENLFNAPLSESQNQPFDSFETLTYNSKESDISFKLPSENISQDSSISSKEQTEVSDHLSSESMAKEKGSISSEEQINITKSVSNKSISSRDIRKISKELTEDLASAASKVTDKEIFSAASKKQGKRLSITPRRIPPRALDSNYSKIQTTVSKTAPKETNPCAIGGDSSLNVKTKNVKPEVSKRESIVTSKAKSSKITPQKNIPSAMVSTSSKGKTRKVTPIKSGLYQFSATSLKKQTSDATNPALGKSNPPPSKDQSKFSTTTMNKSLLGKRSLSDQIKPTEPPSLKLKPSEKEINVSLKSSSTATGVAQTDGVQKGTENPRTLSKALSREPVASGSRHRIQAKRQNEAGKPTWKK